MSYAAYIPIFLLVFLVFWLALRTRKCAGYHHAAQLRRRRGEKPVMEEIIRSLMGKGVQVTTINDTLTGKLMDYQAGWLTLADAKGRTEHVNGDYIVKLKEIPIKF